MSDSIKIQRALISCWDKTGIAEFASELSRNGVEIISSGGTARHLSEQGIPVIKVEEITGFPEILDGRVKTLHPLIHGAILAKRTPEHLAQLKAHGIRPIDLVIVNLYPFLEQVKESGKNLDDMVEVIDIGGPAMLRAAAKNFEYVAVLHHPDQYQRFLESWRSDDGQVPGELRRSLAAEAFFYSSYYDSRIAEYLDHSFNESRFPERLSQFFIKKQDLRYGENPHQPAALYGNFHENGRKGERFEKLWGKEMSFNNFVDVSAAYNLALEFAEPMAAVIKHTNPCGAATAASLTDAFRLAHATDPLSAYGGIVAVNRPIDKKTAEQIGQSFFECVVAPDYEAAALQILQKKKNLRLLKANLEDNSASLEFKYLSAGVLAQGPDNLDYLAENLRSVGSREPSEQEKEDLLFAWKIVKHVKSNAIVFVKQKQLLGVGAGQMSRVDAVKLAGMKARQAGHDLDGAVMASDAFFPFPDGVEEAAAVGIRAVIQPGGSIRDEEVIAAAKQNEMAMFLTGVRHFKH